MKTELFAPVLEWLDAGAPHNEKEPGFNMNQFWAEVPGAKDYAEKHCGTAMCIAGAVADFNDLLQITDSGDPMDVGRYIGLTRDQSYALFYAGAESCGDLLEEVAFESITPAMAAHAIRSLIATGTVEWDESLA